MVKDIRIPRVRRYLNADFLIQVLRDRFRDVADNRRGNSVGYSMVDPSFRRSAAEYRLVFAAVGSRDRLVYVSAGAVRLVRCASRACIGKAHS